MLQLHIKISFEWAVNVFVFVAGTDIAQFDRIWGVEEMIVLFSSVVQEAE